MVIISGRSGRCFLGDGSGMDDTGGDAVYAGRRSHFESIARLKPGYGHRCARLRLDGDDFTRTWNAGPNHHSAGGD